MFIASPWLALVPAAVFALLWYARRRKAAAVAAAVWLGYGGYEYLMKLRVLCSGECNIRVDLLVLYPLLGGLSLAAAWASRRPAAPAGR